jgi:5-methylcytosine-specific restriction endonuclease McrA
MHGPRNWEHETVLDKHEYHRNADHRYSLYKTKRWQRLRDNQLRRVPLCEMCMRRGVLEVAMVVDHVVKHRGDRNMFFLGKLQSLCKRCHDGEKQHVDINGFSNRIGADGWPIDPNHPVHRNTRGRTGDKSSHQS